MSSRVIALVLALSACAPAPPLPSAEATEPPAAERPAPTPAERARAVEGAPASTPRATATLEPRSGSQVGGIVVFEEQDGKVWVHGEVTGLTPGPHGIHVHETGDCSAPDASSAGGHFDPRGHTHGAPGEGHAGDLGNVLATPGGSAPFDVTVDQLAFEGPSSVIGRAVVVHAERDDLTTQPSGASGDRIACGVIHEVKP